jgi:hypothetical protein
MFNLFCQITGNSIIYFIVLEGAAIEITRPGRQEILANAGTVLKIEPPLSLHLFRIT